MKQTKFIAIVAVLLAALTVFACAAYEKTIKVFTGVTLYLNDKEFKPTDANGNPVEAFIYNGTTYLPVRAVSQALETQVQWEGKSKSVYIGKHTGDKPAVWLDELDYFTSSGPSFEFYNEDKDNLGEPHNHALTRNGFVIQASRTYMLNGQYSAISGTFYQRYKYRSDDGKNTLKIYGDGELLYSATVSGGIEPIPFSVDLTGVLKLEIKIEGIRNSFDAAVGECGLWT